MIKALGGKIEFHELENSSAIEKINAFENTICSNGKQQILVRTIDAVSDPVLLSKVKTENLNDGIKYLFSDSDEKIKITLLVHSSSKGLKFSLTSKSKLPIWLIEWRLTGFDLDEVLIPALGGQSITKEMPEGTTLSYKYPFWWNAQFVIGKFSEGGILLRSEDKGTGLKLLRIGKEDKKFSFTFGFEAKAPITNGNLTAEWFLDSFRGDWENGVEIHREWMENKFNLLPFRRHPHYTKWMNEINFILELWGARRDKDEPAHSFKQMIEKLHEFKKIHNPKNTLLYLPGFAENGIDSQAPSYNPSEQCGGEKDFKKLIATAHKLGYRVMLHTNVLAMTYTHPLYKKFKRYQVVDVFGREQGWAMDIDGDWLTEPYFAYINPGAKQWSDLMIKIIGGLVKKYKVDAIFLDQTLLAFNEIKGPDFIEGMRDHIQRLQKAFPKILFAGEGLHEQNVMKLPVAQIHGIDSIAEVHGMEGQAPWRDVHPVSAYLFGKYTRYTAHLLTKHPSHPMFQLQEDAYSKLNVIPALCLYSSKHEIDTPATRQMIKRAKLLK